MLGGYHLKTVTVLVTCLVLIDFFRIKLMTFIKLLPTVGGIVLNSLENLRTSPSLFLYNPFLFPSKMVCLFAIYSWVPFLLYPHFFSYPVQVHVLSLFSLRYPSTKVNFLGHVIEAYLYTLCKGSPAVLSPNPVVADLLIAVLVKDICSN